MAVAITQTADPAGVAASATIATYSSVSIGVAATDRIVAVVVGTELASSTPSACTIDYGSGDKAMIAGTTGNLASMFARIFYLNVPTGTTATIKVTFSAVTPTGVQNHIAVYRVVGAISTVLSEGGASSTDMDATSPLTTGSNVIPTDGAFLAIAVGADDTNAKAWANATEDLDEDAGDFRFTTAMYHTAGTATRTCTGTTNGEDGAMSWLVFQPSVTGVNYQSHTTVDYQSASTLVINKPAGLAVGDALIAFLGFWSSGSVSSAPSGFSYLGSTDEGGGGGRRVQCYGKIADSGDVSATTFTFNLADSSSAAGILYRFTGTASSLISAYAGSGTTNTPSPSFAGLTPSANNVLVQSWIEDNAGAGGNVGSYAIATTNPTWTERFEGSYFGGGLKFANATASIRSAATATGNFTCTNSDGDSSNQWGGMMIAIPPQPPSNVKSYNTNLQANIKSINGNPIANVKSLNTNTNV